MVSPVPGKAVIGLTCLALLLGGCSAGASSSVTASSSASAIHAVPSGTVTMATLGWKNGPADRIVLPIGASIDRRVDQGNVITAIGNPTVAESVRTTLVATLPTYGWTITASAGGSLIFSDARYDGAFTSDSSLWALTIRVKA
jgi:hypothetical protein